MTLISTRGTAISTEPWLPTLYTLPLSENYPTDGDRLVRVANKYWSTDRDRVGKFKLDAWQEDLFRRVLELYPPDHPTHPGQLRYKQVVISMGRQNGKSLIGSLFALYGLKWHAKGAKVLSIAENMEQARIVFKRTKYGIESNPALKKLFLTPTNNAIRTKDKTGEYFIKPGVGRGAVALNGFAISACIFDELHLCSKEMYSQVLEGMKSFPESILIGITTAGDEDSELLLSLYDRGKKAIADPTSDERFGFFLWEAPYGCDIDDPAALISANPAIASGRIPVEAQVVTQRTNPDQAKARQMGLNQFVTSDRSWVSLSDWMTLAGGEVPEGRPVFSVDRTEGWEKASVAVTVRSEDMIHTAVIASMNNPTHERLVNLLERMNWHAPQSFVMDGYMLGDVGKELKKRGLPVAILGPGDMINVAETSRAVIKDKRVSHANNPELNAAVPEVRLKPGTERSAISRSRSKGRTDAVIATAMGIYFIETKEEPEPFVGFFRHNSTR